jgi:hypothetical protein
MDRRIFWLLLALSFLFLCGVIPLPGRGTGQIVGMLLFILAVVGWPIFVGPRLHEKNWRILADRLGLTFQPRHSQAKGTPTSVAGTYLDHQIHLTTHHTRRHQTNIFELILTVGVHNPSDYIFGCRKLGKIDMGVQRGLGRAGTGDADFDQYFMVTNAHPEDFATTLMRTPGLGQQLSRIVKGNRPIFISLQNEQLIYREQHGLFGGAEADIDRLIVIIEAMLALAEAVETQQ